ncbi:Ig and FN3 domain-containing protein, partial [Escherichia coli]|nr:Ig and FN3 domain-containing protein [Escherichia coli]
TWFKNDTILIENSRIEVRRTSDGRCQLKIKPGKEYDVGIYKCIARNSQGSVVCRARLSLGDVPGTISPPTIKDISAHSILLAWSLPKFDGHSYIKQYKVEFKKVQDENWLTA